MIPKEPENCISVEKNICFSIKALKNGVKSLIEGKSSMESSSSNLISAFSKNDESDAILKNNNLKKFFSFFVIFFENLRLIVFFKFVNFSEK